MTFNLAMTTGSYHVGDSLVKLKCFNEDLLLSAEQDDVRMTLPFLY